jgi:hypothetical protein
VRWSNNYFRNALFISLLFFDVALLFVCFGFPPRLCLICSPAVVIVSPLFHIVLFSSVPLDESVVFLCVLCSLNLFFPGVGGQWSFVPSATTFYWKDFLVCSWKFIVAVVLTCSPSTRASHVFASLCFRMTGRKQSLRKLKSEPKPSAKNAVTTRLFSNRCKHVLGMRDPLCFSLAANANTNGRSTELRLAENLGLALSAFCPQ